MSTDRDDRLICTTLIYLSICSEHIVNKDGDVCKRMNIHTPLDRTTNGLSGVSPVATASLRGQVSEKYDAPARLPSRLYRSPGGHSVRPSLEISSCSLWRPARSGAINLGESSADGLAHVGPFTSTWFALQPSR